MAMRKQTVETVAMTRSRGKTISFSPIFQRGPSAPMILKTAALRSGLRGEW